MSARPAAGHPTLDIAVVDADDRPITASFHVTTTWEAGASAADWRLVAHVRHVGSEPTAASVHVSTSLDAAADPWWLIPGAFYGENRPAANTRAFPRFEIGADSPSDAERLVSSAWEFRADRAATPAVFAWPDTGAGGVALATGEESELGLTGIGFAHDAATNTANVHLRFPFRESPVTYYGDEEPRPPERGSFVFAPGAEVEFTVRVFLLEPDRHAYAPVLRALHAESAPTAPLRPWVDVAAAAELAADGLHDWHYDPDPGVLLETVGFDRGVSGRDGLSVDRQAMHVGWISGIPWAYALLRHGLRTMRAEQSDAARRVLDFIAANLSPSGTFWGVWYRNSGWSTSWTPIPNGLHARTLGEATLFLVRALELEPQHSVWAEAARSNLDAIVDRQRADGNLGAVHDATTGEVLSWEGASALTWISALVEARSWDERYLPAAERAGEYYARFVDNEFIHGAPEDVDLAPTSEDGYAAVMAYVALFEATGGERWLDLARRAADWMLTFRYSYNVSFDPQTLLGAYGFAARGADQASPSNQHLHAYGLICTRELRLLSDALGDPHYAERADETLSCFRQFIARNDGDFNAYRGMVSERFYQTSCFQAKGMLLTLSHAWSVGVLLLACEQTLEE